MNYAKEKNSKRLLFFLILLSCMTYVGYILPVNRGLMKGIRINSNFIVLFQISGFLFWFVIFQLIELFLRVNNKNVIKLLLIKPLNIIGLYKSYYERNGNNLDWLLILHLISIILLILSIIILIALIV